MPVRLLSTSLVILLIISSNSIGVASGDDLVSIQHVSSQRGYLIEQAAEGQRIYNDREYVIKELPSGLSQFPMIRTSNDDDRVDAAEHLRLRLSRQATIYVCWDERAFRPATWLKGWRRTKDNIEADDTDFILYRKVFDAGDVTLGGNMRRHTGAKSNYFVIVAPNSESHGLEDAHTVDDVILSVTRPGNAERDATTAAGSRRPPPTRAPRVPPGFAVKLFAHEPMIHNPCAMAFDNRGRLFVAFGPQYRKPRPDTPGDQVAILIDENDDGVADRRHVFAHGFNCIQGIVWNGDELWVANAPDLTLVRDLDGDDRADEYIRIYTDLGNLEHGLHGLNWAPDGKLYMSKGNSKGHNRPEEDGRVAPRAFRELFGLAHPEGAPDLPPAVKFTAEDYYRDGRGYHDPSDDWGRQGGVLRCGPLGRDPEIVSRGFRNPWGIAFDEEFCWLGTDNDQDQGDKIFTPFFGAHFGWGHAWSYKWNDPEHLPTVPASAPLYEGSGTGVAYYSASQFPSEYRNVFLINDWLRNATYLYRSRWNGALRQSETEEVEFFAVQDDGGMFKPTDIKVGPDGSLYIASWGVEYGVEWKAGNENKTQLNEGRIYKIWYTGNALPARTEWLHSKRHQPLAQWSVDQLVDDLGPSALPIWRVNAQNELVRRGADVRRQLGELLTASELSTMQQTWMLWAMGRAALEDREVDQRLASCVTDEMDLNLRMQALRILGFRNRESSLSRPLPTAVASALEDPNVRIRFEAVQAIRQARDRSLLSSLKRIAADESDQLTFYATWQAIRDLGTVAERKQLLSDERPGVRFAALLGLMDEFEITKDEVLQRIETDSDPRVRQWGMKWVVAGGPPRTVSNQKERVPAKDKLTADDIIARLESAQNDSVRQALLQLLSQFRVRGDRWTRVKHVYDSHATIATSEHDVATMLTVLASDRRGHPLLWDALDNSSALIRRAAADGLANEDAREFLLDKLGGSPGTHRLRYAVEALVKRLPAGVDSRAGTKSRSLTDSAAMNLERLYNHSDDAQLKSDVIKLLASSEASDFSEAIRSKLHRLAKRAAQEADPRIHQVSTLLAEAIGETVKVLERMPATVEDVLPLLTDADPARGHDVFFERSRANCLNCHRVGEHGTDFAPSLSDIGRRLKPREILESILYPSRKITEGFAVTQLATTDGRIVSGVVVSETSSIIHLFQSDGKQIEIRTLRSANCRSYPSCPIVSAWC